MDTTTIIIRNNKNTQYVFSTHAAHDHLKSWIELPGIGRVCLSTWWLAPFEVPRTKHITNIDRDKTQLDSKPWKYIAVYVVCFFFLGGVVSLECSICQHLWYPWSTAIVCAKPPANQFHFSPTAFTVPRWVSIKNRQNSALECSSRESWSCNNWRKACTVFPYSLPRAVVNLSLMRAGIRWQRSFQEGGVSPSLNPLRWTRPSALKMVFWP